MFPKSRGAKEDELICVRNLGSKSLEEVKNKIEELGLHLRSSDEE